jgi:hypothetical protein
LSPAVNYSNNTGAGQATASYTYAGDANHTGSSDSTTFTIDKATLTVKAEDATKLLGAANPTFNAGYSGFVNGETLATSGVSGSPSLTTNATAASPVGSYTITAAQGTLAAGNYSFNFVNGTLKTIYKFDGFRQPVDNNGVFNTVKAGSAIPVKFSLFGNQGLNILNPANPVATTVTCPKAMTTDLIEETVSATSNSFTYDATADQYNYVWKTQSTFAGKCYKLDVALNDGTHHEAYFNFTK